MGGDLLYANCEQLTYSAQLYANANSSLSCIELLPRPPTPLSVTMARNQGTGSPPQDTTAIDLSRLIARLQNILVTPDSATETKLRASSYEREKVGNVSLLPCLVPEDEAPV